MLLGVAFPRDPTSNSQNLPSKSPALLHHSIEAKIYRLLAVIHGVDYLTPSIVALAAKKVFRHRIVVARPEDDRSLQYGSDLRAVAKVLEYATPDTILESVLTLEAPL